MLQTLHIENYALIERSDIRFDNGFVAITGETGAGKSILLGALGMLLGDRADSQVLFDRNSKCIVEATFDINNLGLEPFFEENNLDYDPSLIVRREILPSGKSRAFVNDSPVLLTMLKELGAKLVDIHSQHDTLLLSDSSFRITLIDSYSNIDKTTYNEAYKEYTQLKQQLERLTQQEQQNRKEHDYITFLWNELEEAQLSEGEQEALEAEASLLANAEEVKQSLGYINELADAEEHGALTLLSSAKNSLNKIAHCHKDLESLEQRLDSALIELRDIVNEINTLDGTISYSAQRQEEVEERLGLLDRLEKKHGVESDSELIAIRNQYDEQLQSVGDIDEQIKHTMEAVDQAYNALQKAGSQLTATRKKNASSIEKELLPLLHSLGMPEAQIKVEIEPLAQLGPLGGDTIAIRFNANKGSELREMSRIASGGEMSRLMLAIKHIIAQHSQLPTILFDEIDTGISGDIALKAAHLLQEMGSKMQVIAITHLPQMAAQAPQHLKVYKRHSEDNGQRTISSIKELSKQEHIHEIAVMLSCDPPTQAALQTAKELTLN